MTLIDKVESLEQRVKDLEQVVGVVATIERKSPPTNPPAPALVHVNGVSRNGNPLVILCQRRTGEVIYYESGSYGETNWTRDLNMAKKYSDYLEADRHLKCLRSRRSYKRPVIERIEA